MNRLKQFYVLSYDNISFIFALTAGEDVQTVQGEVAEILKGRIVVGHAIHNDLKV